MFDTVVSETSDGALIVEDVVTEDVFSIHLIETTDGSVEVLFDINGETIIVGEYGQLDSIIAKLQAVTEIDD